jgi:alpha-ribazole phosphatase
VPFLIVCTGTLNVPDSHSTTIIDLLRHGEVEGGEVFCGSSDDMLTDEGWQQMQDALEGKSGWDMILSSPLQRCCEFAESLANEEDLKLHINEQFQEIHFGDWEGCSPDDILQTDAQNLQAWWQSPTRETPPRGEDFQDFRSRVLKAFNQLTKKYQDEQVLLITHAGVIRVILMDVLGMQDENLFRLNVDHASFSRVRIYRDHTGQWGTLIKHG